jgi:hypothetical protein
MGSYESFNYRRILQGILNDNLAEKMDSVSRDREVI